MQDQAAPSTLAVGTGMMLKNLKIGCEYYNLAAQCKIREMPLLPALGREPEIGDAVDDDKVDGKNRRR